MLKKIEGKNQGEVVEEIDFYLPQLSIYIYYTKNLKEFQIFCMKFFNF